MDDGDDILLGGFGDDALQGNAGNDILIGDNGEINFDTSGIITEAKTTSFADGGVDNLNGGDGNNIIFGGFAGDVITGLAGNDIVVGDNGTATFTAGILTKLESTDLSEATGGNDTINVGDGTNQVIGGAGADTITGGSGEDQIMGDHGEFVYTTAGLLSSAKTTLPSLGGDDVIDAGTGTGSNVVFGGQGADTITSSTALGGRDILVGDNGEVILVNNIVTSFKSTDVGDLTGGDDVIIGGDADTYALGGTGADTITTGSGNDWILGDHGEITYNADGSLSQAVSTFTDQGGSDTIDAGDGNNFIIAGFGSDNVTSGSGNDIILGDSGVVNADTSGLITDVVTIPLDIGGNDTINSGDGNNVVLGGTGSDVITTGSGNDTVAGDNATITFSNGIRSSFITTDANGGNDTISLGAGDDQAIGGVGSDTIRALDGKNVLLGDNGTIISDVSGDYIFARTGSVSLGAGDFITGGAGTDVIFGGVGGDTLSGGAGDDLIMGDAGEVTRNGLQLFFGSVDLLTGGADILTGGAGNDIMIGGFGSDLFFGSFSEDAIVGQYGSFTLSVDQNYDFVQTTSALTFPIGEGIISSSQSDLYEANELESYQQQVLNNVMATSGTGIYDTGEGFGFSAYNPLSGPALVEAWGVLHNYFGNTHFNGPESSADGSIYPFRIMIDPDTGDVIFIDPDTGDVIIIDESSDPDSEGDDDNVQELSEENQENQENQGAHHDSDDPEGDADSNANDVNGDPDDTTQDEGDTDSAGSNTNEDNGDPENTAQDENESNESKNQTFNDNIGSDPEVMHAVAASVAGWGVVGQINSTIHKNSKLDTTEVNKISQKCRFIRWDSLNL